jgi:transcriptional regulator with XRE-family HTH domain
MPQRTRKREPKVPKIGIDGLSFGARLRVMREYRGWSYADLAARSGLSSQAIQKYESNPASEPEYFNGLKIARALGVSPWDLAGEHAPESQLKAVPGNEFFAPLQQVESDEDRTVTPLTLGARLSALEGQGARHLVVARRVGRLDDALQILLSTEALPETLRDRLREVLAQ